MAFLIEILILCAIFTLVFVGATIKDPLSMVHDYPPEIIERVRALGLLKEEQERSSLKFMVKRIFVIILFAFVFAFVVYTFNNADTFLKGLLYSYFIWVIVNWYDTLVIDLLWFRNSKKVRIKGTEDMEAYRNCIFHIKAGFKGMLLGVPACLLTGLFVEVFSYFVG